MNFISNDRHLIYVYSEQQLSVAGMLIFVAVIKFILTSFSFGAKLPGGIWMPLICIGACVGRAVGILMNQLEE
jgi:chloride channel 3/4/5